MNVSAMGSETKRPSSGRPLADIGADPVRARQVFAVEDPSPEAAGAGGCENPGAHEAARCVVDGVAEHCCRQQQDDGEADVERAGRCQCPHGEEQRIAGKKGGHHQAGLGEHDQEQEGVDPDAVFAGELDQVLVQV